MCTLGAAGNAPRFRRALVATAVHSIMSTPAYCYESLASASAYAGGHASLGKIPITAMSFVAMQEQQQQQQGTMQDLHSVASPAATTHSGSDGAYYATLPNTTTAQRAMSCIVAEQTSPTTATSAATPIIDSITFGVHGKRSSQHGERPFA